MSLKRSIKSRVARFDKGLVARQFLSIAYKCMFSVDSMLLAAFSHSQAFVLQQTLVSTFDSTTFTQVMRQVASKSQYRYSTALHEDCDVTHAQTSPLYHKVSPRRITIDALQARGSEPSSRAQIQYCESRCSYFFISKRSGILHLATQSWI
jgi:hypothetical protein